MTTAAYIPAPYGEGDQFLNGVPARALTAPEFAALSSASPVAIASSSVADPTIITTSAPHGLADYDWVTIAGHAGSTPDLNGRYRVRVISPTTFWLPIAVSVGGAGGTSLRESQQALVTAAAVYTVS